jgi:hypothetical protein
MIVILPQDNLLSDLFVCFPLNHHIPLNSRLISRPQTNYKVVRKMPLLQAEIMKVRNNGYVAADPRYDEDEHGLYAVKVIDVEVWGTHGLYLGSDSGVEDSI